MSAAIFLVPKFPFGNAIVGAILLPGRGGNGNCLSKCVPKWKFGNEEASFETTEFFYSP